MSMIAAALDRAEVVEDPYAHLVVDQALPAEIAGTILDEMPPIEVLSQGLPLGSNRRFYLPTEKALADPRISNEWKAAIGAVNDAPQGLLDWVTGNLGSHILAAYPDFEARFGPLDGLKAVPRAQPNRRRNEVGFDAQIVVNSPALSEGTSVRGPHLDRPDKLISALLYLRSEDDNSTGADLQMFEPVLDEPVFDQRNDLSREFGAARPHLSLPSQPAGLLDQHPTQHPWCQPTEPNASAAVSHSYRRRGSGAAVRDPEQRCRIASDRLATHFQQDAQAKSARRQSRRRTILARFGLDTQPLIERTQTGMALRKYRFELPAQGQRFLLCGRPQSACRRAPARPRSAPASASTLTTFSQLQRRPSPGPISIIASSRVSSYPGRRSSLSRRSAAACASS